MIVPDEKPKFIKASALSPYSAKVTWKGIEKINWRANSISYTIKYREKNRDNKQIKITPGTNSQGFFSQKLGKLKQDTVYIVPVLANNSAGNGPEGEEVRFQTNSCKLQSVD